MVLGSVVRSLAHHNDKHWGMARNPTRATHRQVEWGERAGVVKDKESSETQAESQGPTGFTFLPSDYLGFLYYFGLRFAGSVTLNLIRAGSPPKKLDMQPGWTDGDPGKSDVHTARNSLH